MQPVEDLVDPSLLPNLDELVTEDGKPVDNMFVERLYRLLTEPLISCWSRPGGEPYMVMANVGWFYAHKEPPLVPDVMLILDVTRVAPPRRKEGRSYFQWLYGKPPEVVIEVVSDKLGGEETHKMDKYARLRLQYYVIFDPDEILGHGVLRAFELVGKRYRPIDPGLLPDVGLGMVLWQGTFQDIEDTWLRWCDEKGHLIPTGAERAEAERQRADAAKQRARSAQQRAKTAEDKLERLRAKLREAGIDPDED